MKTETENNDTKRLDWLLNYMRKWGYYKTREDIDAAMPEPRKHVTDGSLCWCNPRILSANCQPER